MNKKVLMVATVPSMIGQFNMDNIQILLDAGYDVDVACDFSDRSVWPSEKIEKFKKILNDKGISYFQIDFSRKPLSIKKHILSYKQLMKLIKEKNYSFIHTHTPIASAIARLVAKKYNIKVIYTAHGFHFYKGAPLKNWIVFYPIERLLSSKTDILITINKEDYKLALDKMKASRIEFVNGVGIDSSKFLLKFFDKEKKRCELGIGSSDVMVFSVGELNKNKNHEVIIKALAQIDSKNIHYFIAGQGNKKEYLQSLAKEYNVNLHLLGFRTDIIELLNVADIYAFPSQREGLSVALMEAIAAGLPCVVSKIRGNVDLIDDEENGYLVDANDISGYSKAIKKIIDLDEKEKKLFKEYSLNKINNYDIKNVRIKMKGIYND